MAIRLNSLDWEAVRLAYVRGESAKSLARRFPIKADSIHKRSSRERWRESLPAAPHNNAAVDRLEAVADRLEAAARALAEAST
jgi:hypothetical protein